MSIDTASQEELKATLIEMAKAGREGYRNAYKQARLGAKEPNDQQFMAWWMLRNSPVNQVGQPNPMYDPDFARALEFVDGGKELLRRAARIVAKQQAGPKPLPVEAFIREEVGNVY